MIDANELRAELSHLGETAVAIKIVQGDFTDERKAFAEHWLREQAVARETTAATRLEREGKLLQLARETHQIAQEATDTSRLASDRSEAAQRSARNANVMAWLAWGVTTAAVLFDLWFHMNRGE